MFARSALIAVAPALVALPAAAQDANPPPLPPLEAPALPPLADDARIVAAPLPEPAADGGWQGEWQGEWAEDGRYRGTWSGTWSDPGPTAARAIDSAGVASTGYAAGPRMAWLEQCRSAYPAGQPDPCEGYLQQAERSAALAAQGATMAPGAYGPLPGVAGAYPPVGYGYPYAPVMWVRVPIVRQQAEAAE